jgi:large subunit ribosomal protein L23
MSLLTLIPRVSEKAYATAQNNTYVFNVPTGVNKQQIAEAVAAQYGVTVTGVKTIVVKGKAVRYSRGKRAYPGTTNRSDFKKAYVTLAEGSRLEIFDEEEETK